MQLFRPLQLGQVRLENRIAMVVEAAAFVRSDGLVAAELHNYCLARAQSGVGLLVINPVFPLPPSQPGAHLGLYTDAQGERWQTLVDALHPLGTALMLMLDQPLPAARDEPGQRGALTAAWATAARRARLIGVDGVLLTTGLDGPFGPVFEQDEQQRRQTSWRSHLLIETVEQIRAAAGSRLVIGVRLSIGEHTNAGLPMHDARVLAKRLASASVGLFEVSAEPDVGASVARFPGWLSPLSMSLKAVLETPVLIDDMTDEPHWVDQLIADGCADLLALNQALHNEPTWPQRARSILKV